MPNVGKLKAEVVVDGSGVGPALGTAEGQFQHFYQRQQAMSRDAQIKARAAERGAWQEAMTGVLSGGDLFKSKWAPTGVGGTVENRLAMQRAGQSGFGTSAGVDLRGMNGRDLAKAAADAAKSTGGMGPELKGAVMELADKWGLGGLTKFAGANMGAVGVVGGVAAAGKWAYDEVAQRNSLARATAGAQATWGTTADDTSRLLAVGIDQQEGSHLQRAMAGGSDAFQRLGLDAATEGSKSLKDAMVDVSEALKNVANPADRMKIAMDLFGKSGEEMIPKLSNLKQKLDEVAESKLVSAGDVAATKAYDSATKAAGEQTEGLSRDASKAVGLNAGFGTTWQRLKAYAAATARGGVNGKEFADLTTKFDKEDFNVSHAAEIEKADQYKQQQAKSEYEAQSKRFAMAKQMDESIKSAKLGAAGAAGNYSDIAFADRSGSSWVGGSGKIAARLDALRAEGADPKQLDALRTQLEQEDRIRGQVAARTQLMSMQEQVLAKNETHEETILRHLGDQVGKDSFLVGQARERLEILKQEAIAKAEANSRLENENRILAENARLMTPRERFDEAMRGIANDADSPFMSPAQRARREADARRTLLSGAGVASPADDFAAGLARLNSVRDQITPMQFERTRRSLEQSALSGLMAGHSEVGLAPTMARYSQEAYEAIARRGYDDPTTRHQKEMIELLESIKRNTADNEDPFEIGQAA